jgi:sulfonate transport system substrate-binding protein
LPRHSALAALMLIAAICSVTMFSTRYAAAQDGKGRKIIIDTTVSSGLNMAGRARQVYEDYFKKLGVDVQYVQLFTTSQLLEGISSGSVDVVEFSYIGIATGAAARVPFSIIAAANNGGGDLLLVPKASSVKTLADLKGKTIGVAKGSSSWAMLLRALAASGLSPTDVQIINLQPDEGQNAFLAKRIDSWSIWAGMKTDAVNDDNSALITTAEQVGLIPGLVAVRNSFLEQNPDLVVTYLQARQKSLELLTNERAATIEAIAKARNLTGPRVEFFMKSSAPRNDRISEENIVSLQSVAQLLHKFGETRRSVDIAPFVNNEPMKKALQGK